MAIDVYGLGATLYELLAGVHGAEDNAAARTLLATLPEGHSVVTRAGDWHGHHWLRLHAAEANPAEGVLARAREIEATAALPPAAPGEDAA